MEAEAIEKIVDTQLESAGALSSALAAIREALGGLSGSVLELVAERTGRPIEEVVAAADDSAPAVTFADSVRCPSCRHGLMDPSFPIDGHASIRLTVSFGMEHGWLRLSALRGSRSFACEFDLPGSGVVNFFCPHCSAEIMSPATCDVCGAPLLPVLDGIGFTEQVCSCRAGKKERTGKKTGAQAPARTRPKEQRKI